MEITRRPDLIIRQQHDTIAVLVAALEAKDPYTEGHSRRVMQYGLRISEELGLSADQIADMEMGGLLHDIGKIGVRDAVLTKEGRLTDEEFEEIKKHPAIGSEIVGKISGITETIIACVRHHHERWDGGGYPDGLAGEDIPLPGRILGVADAFEAMTSSRSYRPALPVQKALEEIKKNSGTQFDPEMAELWLQLMRYTEGSGANILVADDDERIREMFEDVMLPLGHRVVTVADGQRALRSIIDEPFDLIFLDVNMPSLDGLMTLSAIKHHRPDAFAVIVTGAPDDARVAEMLKLGAHKCLPKPLDFNTPTDLVEELMERRFKRS